ncbi:hypothetical protein [Streptomyces sp. NPDC018711]|uniref:hypothetical protein n=1 Tax=Streptomyces sp. NPDC018711 TaxID=3365052 RepID=UPI00378A1D25
MTQNGQGPEHGGGQPWGGAWGPAGGQPGGQPLPPAQPLPPEAPQGAADMQSTQYLPPIPPQQAPPQPGYGYPGPGAADMQATQHMAPVPGGMPPAQGMPPQQPGTPPQPGMPPQQPGTPPAQAAPQPGYGYPGPGAPAAPQPGYGYPGPAAPAAADMQATQHMAPVPPQQGGGSDTQFLGTGPLAHQGPAPAGASDATQYIAPVPAQAPGERQPPAEFDNLFRTETPRAPQQPHAPQGYQQPGPAPYQQQHQPPQPPQQQYGGFQDAYYEEEPEPRRKSPVALIAAVVVGCAVVGLGAGALLSGGDDEKDPKAGGQNVAASSAAPSASAEQPSEKPADPAEPQAQELSKLLATSSSSRQTVIDSVASIDRCKNLDQAATDLRGAAEQRRGLITKLQALSVDKIPDNAALSAALTKAWQASAAADDHYAAWADQMKGKKACKGGHARSTSQKAAANQKSGEATAAKKTAAGLWNPTAAKYGLEKREWTEL